MIGYPPEWIDEIDRLRKQQTYWHVRQVVTCPYCERKMHEDEQCRNCGFKVFVPALAALGKAGL